MLEKSGRALQIGVFVIGILIPVLASLTHNYLISGEFIPVTSSAGVNLFIGSNPASDGMDPFKLGENNSVRIEADRLGLAGAQRSDYFRDHAMRFIRSQPLEWLRLCGKKLLLSIGRMEIDNNADIAERRTAWKWFFVPLLHFGIVFPLAMAALVYVWRSYRRARILLLGYIGFLAVGVVFFVAERFRLPAAAYLIPLAALGAVCIVDDVRRRHLKGLTPVLIILAGAAIVSNIDFFNLSGEEFASITVNKAHVERMSGNMKEARRYAMAGLAGEPNSAGAHFQLGAIEEAEGDPAAAFESYLTSLEHDPFFYASYAGARRILESHNANPSYMDSYVDIILRGEDHIQARERMLTYVRSFTRRGSP
jgi:hypothetical protein